MQTVIVMCGFPRSGKTTYTKTYLKNFIRVSIDDLISMTTGKFNIKFGDFYGKIEKIMIKELVSRGLDVVIDRTSLTRKSRQRTKNLILHSAKEAKLPRPIIKLVVIETPIDICIRRNIKTEKVPPGIFHKMINSFEEPELNEGWDEIIRVKTVI
jgi:tRNA uridine 5-carbamoylmethylation protein Kti12